jgi:hypothetical protein
LREAAMSFFRAAILAASASKRASVACRADMLTPRACVLPSSLCPYHRAGADGLWSASGGRSPLALALDAACLSPGCSGRFGRAASGWRMAAAAAATLPVLSSSRMPKARHWARRPGGVSYAVPVTQALCVDWPKASLSNSLVSDRQRHPSRESAHCFRYASEDSCVMITAL